jgi:hypothetical protein
MTSSNLLNNKLDPIFRKITTESRAFADSPLPNHFIVEIKDDMGEIRQKSLAVLFEYFACT